MLRSTLSCAALLLVLLLLPSAASAATCSVRGSERKLGPDYTTRLVVTGTSCSAGKRVVRAYYNCRRANGGDDGRCRKTIPGGYRCTEGPRAVNKRTGSFDATATCRKGSRRVVHDYQML